MKSQSWSHVIRDTRRTKGLTQSQFALQLGVKVRTLRSWEQGRRNPHPIMARAVLALAN